MGRLVENKSPVTLWTVRSGSRPYIHRDTSDHTFGLETVYPLLGFQGEPHFLHSSSYPPNTLLSIPKGSLSEVEINLHAMRSC